MIKEEYVSWDSAKLLKEEGFPQEGFLTYYNENGTMLHSEMQCAERYARCTKYQAMRWLREVHHINIRVNWHSKRQQWFFDMLDIANIYDYFESEDYLPTYEAAAEAGIQAACKYLLTEQ